MTVEQKEISESPAKVEETKPDANKTPVELLGSMLIDKRREDVEAKVSDEIASPKPDIEQQLQQEEPAKAEDEKSKVPEEKKEEVQEETDPVKRVMSKVQRRIDKIVAKSKTVEEELAETKAELERVRTQQNAQVVGNKDDAKSSEPTDSQIAAYLRKVREEGNIEEEIKVLDFIAERRAKVEKKSAMDEYDGRIKAQQQAKAKNDQAINDLLLDYTVRDDKGKIVQDDPMNLANMNGLLRKTADALFHDPEFKDQYGDPDRVSAYRRAVNDAFRSIYQMGLNKQDSTADIAPKSKRKLVLVEPTDSVEEEVKEAPSSRDLSDHEKVMEEIRNRRNFQVKRVPIRQ